MTEPKLICKYNENGEIVLEIDEEMIELWNGIKISKRRYMEILQDIKDRIEWMTPKNEEG